MDPHAPEWQRDLSIAYERIGDVLMEQGEFDEALKAYRDRLAISERLFAADRSNMQWLNDVWFSYEKVGDAFVAKGKLDDARGRSRPCA